MNLSNKKCTSCKKNTPPLPTNELEEYLGNINGWKLTDGNKKIEREFKFKNFIEPLEFVNKIGKIAEEENHHLDIEFGWGYCRIILSTHSIGGLHENDFIVAAKINGIADV
jgi:4a-hydroxytetrahydrobiopterin dehydratase